MKTILLTDTTLKESFRNGESLYTFKERVELAKVLDRIHADAIRLSPIVHRKADTTVVRTIASVVNDSVLSMPTGYTTEAVDLAYAAVRKAKKPEPAPACDLFGHPLCLVAEKAGKSKGKGFARLRRPCFFLPFPLFTPFPRPRRA